jgi:hypothetical protein
VKAAKKDASRMMLEFFKARENIDPSFLSGATSGGDNFISHKQVNGW